MRDMTPAECESWYRRGKWPCCGGNEYLAGLRGGMCRNIKCPDCGMEMNVVDPDSGISSMASGQVISEPPGYVPPQEPALMPMTYSKVLGEYKSKLPFLIPGIAAFTIFALVVFRLYH